MKRLKFWIGGVIVALATTGIAVAAQPGAHTETVSATFSATAKRVQTRTCEGSDGTYKITRGVYTGAILSSDPRLNGRMRIAVHSVYNADENAGWMRGTVHVRNADAEGRAVARLSAVNLDGNLEGMLTGAGGPRRSHLLANFSATFGEGFSEGQLGTGTSTNQALFFGGGCTKDSSESKDEKKAERGERKQGPEKQAEKEQRSEKPAERRP